MFTGLVSSLGSIVELRGDRLIIDAPGIDELLGASVAIDGCCLTVVASTPAPHDLPTHAGGDPAATTRLAFDLLPETLARTRLSSLAAGAAVNLEPALRAGQPLGGHMVQGHVDATGKVEATHADPDGRWLDLHISVPDDVHQLCIDRGSITINGVSLTVMELTESGVRVQLIPETQARTNLGSCAVGDVVNLEADVIARYVARLLPPNR